MAGDDAISVLNLGQVSSPVVKRSFYYGTTCPYGFLANFSFLFTDLLEIYTGRRLDFRLIFCYNSLMKASDIIKEKPYLIWYTKNYAGLDDKAVVEAVLNYGDWNDVQRLIKILGVGKTARIFAKQISGQRCNYDNKVKHYFKLYFDHYAR